MDTAEIQKLFRESVGDSQAIAGAALGVGLHVTRILANRGLISPNEVESVFAAMMLPLDSGSESLKASTDAQLAPMMAEIRLWAKRRWIGGDDENPS